MKLPNNYFAYSSNSKKPGFKGRTENDIRSIARLLNEKYGVEAHFDPSQKKAAERMLVEVQFNDAHGIPQPARVYTRVGDFKRDHPFVNNDDVAIGLHTPGTNSIFVNPQEQTLKEYKAAQAQGMYAAEKPESHEFSHSTLLKMAGPLAYLDMANNSLEDPELQDARICSIYAAATTENGKIINQTRNEFATECLATAREGKDLPENTGRLLDSVLNKTVKNILSKHQAK